jgi:hypothetical protein
LSNHSKKWKTYRASSLTQTAYAATTSAGKGRPRALAAPVLGDDDEPMSVRPERLHLVFDSCLHDA